MITFSGQEIAVSGVGSGFGQAIARLFASLGGRVFACDIDETAFAALRGDGIDCHRVDLSDRAAAAAWIGAIEPVDVLVNNAGGVAGQAPVPFAKVTDADWDAVLAINLGAAMALSRAVVPAMVAAGRGAIVNICSGASLRASKTGVQAYCAAKHGLLGLTRQLAHELGPQGIRVNAVAPGLVVTGGATQRQWAAYGTAGQQAVIDGIALRRLGTPEDIARAVAFLASDWAGFVNGEILSVDGGQ
ncbi:SDR family NAD(P)-dependent oxidoreductase [Polymorphobacter sp.]|uniref:SDR family NAD(P)-dependent oxidoreductase n=1 Tax=Polymorphobacter sp. TaxID=1909290 RepID=UPI003F71F2AB